MKPGDYLFKTRPAYFFISLYAIIAAVCGVIAFKMLKANFEAKDTGDKTSLIIVVVFAGVFILFGLVCLWCIISLKIFYITEKELIITQPLLFNSSSIPISSIRGISEKDAQVDVDKSPFGQSLITIGQTATLQLQDGKQKRISSLEAGNYHTLIKNLHTRMRNGKIAS